MPNPIVESLYNSLSRSIRKDLPYRLIVNFELLLIIVTIYIYNVLELGHLYIVYPLRVKSSG